jgi:hypothetical protein
MAASFAGLARTRSFDFSQERPVACHHDSAKVEKSQAAFISQALSPFAQTCERLNGMIMGAKLYFHSGRDEEGAQNAKLFQNMKFGAYAMISSFPFLLASQKLNTALL